MSTRSGSPTTSPGALDSRSSAWWLSLRPVVRLAAGFGALRFLACGDLAAPAPIVTSLVPAPRERPRDGAEDQGQAGAQRVSQQPQRLAQRVLSGVTLDLDGPQYELQHAALDQPRGFARGGRRRGRIDRVTGARGLAQVADGVERLDPPGPPNRLGGECHWAPPHRRPRGRVGAVGPPH